MGDSVTLNLSGTEAGHYGDLEDDWKIIMDSIKSKLNCHDEDDLTAERFKRQNKDVLAGWLVDFVRELEGQRTLMRDLRDDLDTVKTTLIVSQSTVIKLQSELLESKSNQLNSVQTDVQTTVQSTVQAEMKSYSQAVSKTTQAVALTARNLKKVVQDVVAQEDRSRNVMIFGLEEENDEKLNVKVGQVFQQLDEKPRVESVRVGQRTVGKARPVKVTLSSSSIVHQILVKSRNLRQHDQYKSVFVCPDRSPDERIRDRQLVLDLKKKIKEAPGKKHFIRNGQVLSENTTSES